MSNVGSTTTGTSTTTTTYDGLSRPTSTTSAVGTSSESKLESTYDAQGHETSFTVTTGPDVTAAGTYDLAGRLVTETLDPGGLGPVTTYTYDPLGRMLGHRAGRARICQHA